MDDAQVPQEGNALFKGLRKAMYARGEDGKVRPIPSAGWQVEEIVTRQALDSLTQRAGEARQRAAQGKASPLEFHMYRARMDLALLCQSTGLWRWRVKRHFRPQAFARLSDRFLRRYAEAMGISVETLRSLQP
ncbi:MAG: hypothetical protein LWX11_07470 [Firmicutes bacterium]|nr:hypothetical protein [Bacillota bacterium]